MNQKIVNTLETWLQIAADDGRNKHKAYFWNAINMIAGDVKISKDLQKQTIEFIKNECIDSDDKEIILRELQGL